MKRLSELISERSNRSESIDTDPRILQYQRDLTADIEASYFNMPPAEYKAKMQEAAESVRQFTRNLRDQSDYRDR
jgi:hypothetical protein